MNESTAQSTPPPEASAPEAATNLTPLPTLAPEEILRGKLEASERENDSLKGENKRLLEQKADLVKRVAELERNPFAFALANLDAGAVMEEAGEKLQKLAAAVRRHQQKGRFSLNIEVKPFKGSTLALVFVPKIHAKEPENEPAQSIFYSDEDGVLSRQDPRQREIF